MSASVIGLMSSAPAAHIHVAEDLCDEQLTRKKYGKGLLERLGHGELIEPSSIFAHCIHLNDADIAHLNEIGLTVAHNPRSNMNNGVGYAADRQVEMPGDAGDRWDRRGHVRRSEGGVVQIARRGAGISPADVIAMLANAGAAHSGAWHHAWKITGRRGGGCNRHGLRPFTPITTANFSGHFIFAMSAGNVRDVIANGAWAMRNRQIQTCDEPAMHHASVEITRRLWERLERIPA